MPNTTSNSRDQESQKSVRGGTPKQHAEAGRQSHKNPENKNVGAKQASMDAWNSPPSKR